MTHDEMIEEAATRLSETMRPFGDKTPREMAKAALQPVLDEMDIAEEAACILEELVALKRIKDSRFLKRGELNSYADRKSQAWDAAFVAADEFRAFHNRNQKA